MKKILIALTLFTIIATPCFAIQSDSSMFGMSDGEKIKKYDNRGSYQGYYRRSGDKVKEYGKSGSYQGYYRQSGNKVKQYDSKGSYQGYYRK